MRRMKIRAVPNMRPGGGPRSGQSRVNPSSSQVSAENTAPPENVSEVSGDVKSSNDSNTLDAEVPMAPTTLDVLKTEFMPMPVKIEKTTTIGQNTGKVADSSANENQVFHENAAFESTEEVSSKGFQDPKIAPEISEDQSLPEQTKQESTLKAAAPANVRRKRFKVTPMVAASRKGNIIAPSAPEASMPGKSTDNGMRLKMADCDTYQELTTNNQSVESINSKDDCCLVNKTDKTEIIDCAERKSEKIQKKISDTPEENEITIIDEEIGSHITNDSVASTSETKRNVEPYEKSVTCIQQVTVSDASENCNLENEKTSCVTSQSALKNSLQDSNSSQKIDVKPLNVEPNKQCANLSEDGAHIVQNSISKNTLSCKRRSKILAKPALSLNKRPAKKTVDVVVKKEPHKVMDPQTPAADVEKLSVSTKETVDRVNEIVPTNVHDFARVIENEETPKREVGGDTAECNKGSQTKITPKRVYSASGENKEPVLQHSKVRKRSRPETTQEDRLEEQDANDSDGSNGDKENSSKGIRNKKEASTKNKSSKQNKGKLAQIGISSMKMKTDNKGKIAENDSEDGNEQTSKQIFRERKEEYRKKITTGKLEPKSMTMFDLIFFNPAANPMPGRIEATKKKRRLSSKCETESVTSDVLEEQKIDDQGLDTSEPIEQSNPDSPEVEVCEENEEPPKESKEDTEKSEDVDSFAPRVKIGANGQIILDEQSLKIRTTAAKNRDEILSKAEVVEESNDSAHYGRWSRKRKRSSQWTMKETARFYKALSTVGTDFSLMETLFAWRSRAELKTKFKKEERSNRALVDKALQDFTQFDFSLFDIESDYDPEEDRKACKEAEREEAKRKRLEIKHEKKERREEERARIKKEKQSMKIRKSNLRRRQKLLNKNKIKHDTSDEEEEEEEEEDEEEENDLNNISSNSDADSVGDDCPINSKKDLGESSKPVKSEKMNKKTKKRPIPKKNPSEISPLVISEVTVTMETVKYNQPASFEEPIVERTIVEDGNGHSLELPTSLQEQSGSQGSSADAEDEQKVWHFPISEIQTLDDGQQIVQVPTPAGNKIVPVPTLTPGTSNVLVMATDAPDSPGECIYHVYLVSPMEKA